jgi:hypothetical protein
MRSGLRLLLAVLLLPSVGTMVSACGEASSGSSDTPVEAAASDRAHERATIRRTIKRAKREGTDGSAARTCRYITSDGQKRAIDAYSFRYMTELKSCPQMVRFARKVEASYLGDARRAAIKRIKLRLSRAAVEFEGPKRGGYGGIVGIDLRKIGSRWQVDDADFVPYGTGK